jgi:hypothetical protein
LVEAAKEAVALVEEVWGLAGGWAAAAKGAVAGEAGCRADKRPQLVMDREGCSRAWDTAACKALAPHTPGWRRCGWRG